MTVTPYLHFEGNSEEALNFYKDVFNGEVPMISRYGESPMPVDDDWKSKIMHARLKFGDSMLFLSDGPKGYKSSKDGNIQLSIDFKDESKMDDMFKKAFRRRAGNHAISRPILGSKVWHAER